MDNKFVINPTETSQWQQLVHEAELHSANSLNEELENYLVCLLMRYMSHPEIANSVIALEFLRSHQAVGKARQLALQDVGDKCLLYSGLFPRQAEKRQVKISYFVDVGQSAYTVLSVELNNTWAALFNDLSSEFVHLMDVLQAMRALDENAEPQLLPLQAIELWHDTGSKEALRVFQRYSKNQPIIFDNLKLS